MIECIRACDAPIISCKSKIKISVSLNRYISYLMFDSGEVTMRQMSVKERRIDQRFQVRLPIHILAADRTRRGETENMSLGGAFIRCEKPPPKDEKVLLTFKNPSGSMQFVLAKVAWTNLESEGNKDKPIGMGIQFMHFLNTTRPSEKIKE